MTDPHPTIRPQPRILDIALYVGGESRLDGHAKVLKLSSNENPFGPSPRAVEAYRAAAGSLHLYPSSDHAALRAAIGEVHGLDPARIVCGAGSDEIIAFLAQAYAGPGTEVSIPSTASGCTGSARSPPARRRSRCAEAERRTDVDAILAAATERTALVFVANPNNPTGTMIPAGRDRAAGGGAAAADAARCSTAPMPSIVEGFDGHAGLVAARDNVVMTRTFSKIHGLGGLRVGWGYGPAHVVEVLNRVRGPFNLSTPALAAAEAAVRDTGYAAFCRGENARNRAALAAALAEAGVPSDPSEANFLLARFRDAGRGRGLRPGAAGRRHHRAAGGRLQAAGGAAHHRRRRRGLRPRVAAAVAASPGCGPDAATATSP